jgi:DNA (cytosine-5)-methyltransferase 3A
MNVISLFNGMNTGRQALENVGIKVNKYYSSEIKPHAIELTQHHFPDTIQVGDVTKWREWDIDWQSIDLILSGSPCQDLSAAGKRAGINGKKSSLFFTFVEILEHVKAVNPNVLFLQENVGSASKLDVGIMSRALGVYPVRINSSLVTAQFRDRYYWSNIKTKEDGMFGDIVTDIPQPKDRNIVLADILQIPIINNRSKNIIMQIKENQVKVRKNYINQYELANYLKSYKNKSIKEISNFCNVNFSEVAHWFRTDKFGSIPKDTIWNKLKECLNIKENIYDKQISEFEIKNGSYDMAKRIYHTDGKHPTLMTITGGHQNKNITDGKDLFYLKPEHWDLLQGFDINYTIGLSNNKRKSLLGDGWTLPVIEHIFKFINK